MLKQVDESSRNAISGELEAMTPNDAKALCYHLRAPLGKSIEELDALLLNDYGDWRQKSGFVLATSNGDGTSDYVLKGQSCVRRSGRLAIRLGASAFASLFASATRHDSVALADRIDPPELLL